MSRKFLFCISLKNGAWIMAFTNLMFAIGATIGGGTELYFVQKDEGRLYLILCVIMGIFNTCAGVVLVLAIMKAKETYVLLYIMLELTNLMIISIFAIFNMFHYESFLLVAVFIGSIVLWYGLYCIYGFYIELAEYNTVKSGVIEISCNPHINPVMTLPEKAIESTAV